MKFVFDAIQVVISQMNGKDHSSHSTHSFNVGRMRIKLCRGWITKAREIYSPTMQVQFRQSTIILVSRTHAHACACTHEYLHLQCQFSSIYRITPFYSLLVWTT